MNIYVMYSGATDVTGEAIKQSLKAEGGQELPKKPYDIFIGWGAKTKTAVKIQAKHILNHPDNIRSNRNKFEALKKLSKAGITVGNFVEASTTEVAAKLKLPVVGRTNYHQSGKNFWLCLSMTQVKEAIAEGAQYFQEYLPITQEYRMHVFGDVFYAVVKTKSKDPQKAYVESHAEKIKNSAESAGKQIDEASVKFALEKIASRNTHSNPLLRSHAEGWTFKEVAAKTDIKALSDVAIAAVKAVGLDFGAVDCGVTEDGKVVVLEVNSGPSLEGTSFTKWMTKFRQFVESKTTGAATKTKAPATTATVPAAEVINVAAPADNSKKAKALMKADLLKELLASADETQVDAILAASAKMLSK